MTHSTILIARKLQCLLIKHDKIDVHIFADGQDGEDIEASLENFGDYVAAQTLALAVAAAPLSEAGDAAEVEWNDGTIRIEVVRR